MTIICENYDKERFYEVLDAFNTNEKEFNETVEELKEWLKEQPHLPHTMDENILKAFALGIKNGIEFCKTRLDRYYTIRNEFQHFFGNRDPRQEDYLVSYEATGFGVMPGFTPENYKVIVLKTLDTDPSKNSYSACLTRLYIFFDLIMKSELSAGFAMIVDVKGFNYQTPLRNNPLVLRDGVVCLQNIYPLKLKKVFIINTPKVFKVFYENIIKPLLSKKIASRIELCSSRPEEIEKFFPREMIPVDMGGEGLSVQEINDLWHQKVVEERDWLMNEGSAASDESKRVTDYPFPSKTCNLM